SRFFRDRRIARKTGRGDFPALSGSRATGAALDGAGRKTDRGAAQRSKRGKAVRGPPRAGFAATALPGADVGGAAFDARTPVSRSAAARRILAAALEPFLSS